MQNKSFAKRCLSDCSIFWDLFDLNTQKTVYVFVLILIKCSGRRSIQILDLSKSSHATRIDRCYINGSVAFDIELEVISSLKLFCFSSSFIHNSASLFVSENMSL